MSSSLIEVISDAAMRAMISSVSSVRGLSLTSLVSKGTSLLKPGSLAALPDIIGEEAAFEVLESLRTSLSEVIGCELTHIQLRVIIDADKQSYHSIGQGSAESVIWVYLDAVDGTIKVAGLGNETDRIRVVNDGSFASAIAMTLPGKKTMDELTVGDFAVAAICDASMAGSSDSPGLFPRGCLTVQQEDGTYLTRSFGPDATISRPAYTSTNTNLQQSFVFLDAFQAFDRKTARPGDEELAIRVFSSLINRNQGGAFDVLRSYGSLSSIIRNMISDQPREEGLWIEAQCTAFVVVNENLPNLIPVVPLLVGCGAICTDFEGKDLLKRKLVEGRTSVAYSANLSIHKSIMAIVAQSKDR